MKKKVFIVSLFLAVIIFIVIFFILNKQYQDSKMNIYKDIIYNLYEVNPDFFIFDENDTAIVKVLDLVNPIYDKNGNISVFDRRSVIRLTKDKDECLGYIVVTKNGDDLDISLSHLCDMIDE